jgi:hypothetical protein
MISIISAAVAGREVCLMNLSFSVALIRCFRRAALQAVFEHRLEQAGDGARQSVPAGSSPGLRCVIAIPVWRAMPNSLSGS